jgi:uncharacterized protein (DUF58 family)
MSCWNMSRFLEVDVGHTKTALGPVRGALTLTGGMLLAVTLAGYLMAVNYNNNLLYLLVFLLLSLFLSGVVLGWLNLRQIEAIGVEAEPVFAGDRLVYRLGVTHRGRRGSEALYLRVNRISGEVADLPEAQSQPLLGHLPTSRRGSFAAVDLRLACDFPLGIFRLSRSVVPVPKVWIYPKPQGDLKLDEHVHRQHAHAGREADEMQSLRRYQGGDNPRRIHWRSYARHQTLLCCEYDGGESVASYVLDERGLASLPLEARLSQLCAWVLEADRLGDEYGLMLGGELIAPDRGVKQRNRCLTRLAGFRSNEASV